jgi:hypothetical protein
MPVAAVVRGFVISRAARRVGTDDAAAERRRRGGPAGPALDRRRERPLQGPLKPEEKLLTTSVRSSDHTALAVLGTYAAVMRQSGRRR